MLLNTQTPSQADYKVRVAGPNGTNESIEMQQTTSTRYNGTFQVQDSGSYIVTAQREGDAAQTHRSPFAALPCRVRRFQSEHWPAKIARSGDRWRL